MSVTQMEKLAAKGLFTYMFFERNKQLEGSHPSTRRPAI